MVLASLGFGLKKILTKPQILIPMLVLMLASMVVTEYSDFILERPVSDMILYADAFPTDNILGFIVSTYPVEILSAIILGSIMLGIGIVAAISTARIAKGEGLMQAVNKTVGELRKSAGLVVIVWAIGIILTTAMLAISWVAGLNDIVGTLLIIIFAIIVFVAFVKLIFVIPALASKELKKAFMESWEFTDDRFWGSFFMILLACIIMGIISYAFAYAAPFAGTQLEMLVTYLGSSVSTTYFVAAISNYFYSK